MKEVRQTLNLDRDAGGTAFKNDDREEEVNPDFHQPVVIDTSETRWQPSPAKGVWRKRLELIGHQQPQLTTIVRFEPGSRFNEHGHPGGEEFIVLSGTFSDAAGDYPAGSYVRNPAGWVHGPWTDKGCELFVKLCQFQPDDHERVVVDTNAGNDWIPTGQDGLERLPLHQQGGEEVALYRLSAGSTDILFEQGRVTELLVLDGDLESSLGQHKQGTWLRFPAGHRERLHSDDGCRFYCKQLNR